jgi:hypothetical protein
VAEGFDDRVLFIQGAGIKPGQLMIADISGGQAAEDLAMFNPNRLRPEAEFFMNPLLNFLVGCAWWMTHGDLCN